MIVQYFIQNKMLSRGNKFQIAISCTVFFAFGILKNWTYVPGIVKIRNENFIARKKMEIRKIFPVYMETITNIFEVF